MKHLFRFLSMVVLVLTACVITSCNEPVEEKKGAKLEDTKWEYRDHEHFTYYYMELWGGEDKHYFFYKELYFEDISIGRPEYTIDLAAKWYSAQGGSNKFRLEGVEVSSTRPDYSNPKASSFPNVFYYDPKRDRIKYKGHYFERIVE